MYCRGPTSPSRDPRWTRQTRRSSAMKKARLAALACMLAAAGVPAAQMLTRWFSMRQPEVRDLDYTRYCISALVGLRAGWHRLYDLEAQHEVARSLGDPYFAPNVYTPPMSILMVPFTGLSLEHGFLVWSTLLLCSVIVCWYLLAPGDAPARAVQLAMVFVPYPVALGLMHGQVIPLQMALLAASYVLLERGRDFSAGALLCVMALKPQGLHLIPFALLVAGRKRAFAGWAVAMAIVGVAVLALIRFDGAMAYMQRLAWARANPQDMMVAWAYTLARRFDSAAMRAAALTAAAGVALIAAFRHRRQPAIAYAAGIVGSLLVSPYLELYDFMLLFPAAWLLLRVAPAAWVVPPLLACYLFLLLSTHSGPGARWVLLCECIWICALACAPPGWMAAHSQTNVKPAEKGPSR